MLEFNLCEQVNRGESIIISTVEPLVTHTPRWTAQGMRYEGLCIWRGMLKIGLKNHQKLEKNQKILNYSTTSMIS